MTQEHTTLSYRVGISDREEISWIEEFKKIIVKNLKVFDIYKRPDNKDIQDDYIVTNIILRERSKKNNEKVYLVLASLQEEFVLNPFKHTLNPKMVWSVYTIWWELPIRAQQYKSQQYDLTTNIDLDLNDLINILKSIEHISKEEYDHTSLQAVIKNHWWSYLWDRDKLSCLELTELYKIYSIIKSLRS